jgi:HPt (histidine-containing phosphotransfer) domain-containing protein
MYDINLADGTERYGSEAAYREVLRAYYIHTPPLLEKLRSFSVNGGTGTGLSEYTILVHSLKGSSYGIGANAVGTAAAELESAAKAGDLERVRTVNGPLIEQTERLLGELGELLQQAAAGSGDKPRAAAPERGLLERLREAARRYKSSVVEAIVAELESREYETGGELVVWLREMADNLEYDAIRERLEKDI